MGPQLKASLCGELLTLEKNIIQNTASVEHWFREMFKIHPAPVYSSVDLRNSCFKIAPVDTNLFPAGFNNIGENDMRCVVQAFMSTIEKKCCHVKKVLLIPENHTRNTHYFDHLGHLATYLSNSGLEVKIGSFNKELYDLETIYYKSSNNIPSSFKIFPINTVRGRLIVDGIIPELILINNDFSSGVPNILRHVEDQIILPSLDASWSFRRKSEHFKQYKKTTKEFSSMFQFDSWLTTPITESCSDINFQTKEGETCLTDKISDLMKKISRKYNEHEIKKKPFVVIKADSGTYGMGVMTIRDANEVLKMNRKQRNKMSKTKEGMLTKNVLIQEGVYSFETVVNSNLSSVAEPVVYMVDKYVVGGFYRIHSNRDLDENLNAPGMQFVPLAFEDSCQSPAISNDPESTTNRLYFYSVIARLAALSAAREFTC